MGPSVYNWHLIKLSKGPNDTHRTLASYPRALLLTRLSEGPTRFPELRVLAGFLEGFDQNLRTSYYNKTLIGSYHIMLWEDPILSGGPYNQDFQRGH